MSLFADYPTWRERQVAAILGGDPERELPCPACGGDGAVECGECGADKDCDKCESTGKVAARDITESQARGLTTGRDYVAAIIEDAQALARWQGRDVAELLVAHGFRPYTTVTFYSDGDVARVLSGKLWLDGVPR